MVPGEMVPGEMVPDAMVPDAMVLGAMAKIEMVPGVKEARSDGSSACKGRRRKSSRRRAGSVGEKPSLRDRASRF